MRVLILIPLTKKCRPGVAAFLAASLFLHAAFADNQCSSLQIDETATVKEVIDGDTVRLSNNRLLRFIGINAPEIDHKHGRSEPYATAAREAVVKLIGPQRRIAIQYGEERQDRHGRWLAHLFTRDGRNIQQQLLRQGLAFWIAVPPNLYALSCYRDAESLARVQHAGIWNEPYFAAKSIASLDQDTKGFVVLSGVIRRVGQGRKNIWLNLADSMQSPLPLDALFYGKVALRIRRADLHYFQAMIGDSASDLSDWQGRRVTARGWIYVDKYTSKYRQPPQLVMTVKHPAALQFETAQ